MNSILTIRPYKAYHDGPWVFDDDNVGLLREPFVGKINYMIDCMLRDAGIRGAEHGFTALFSAAPFPGYQMKLDYVEGEAQRGTDYACPQYGGVVGWLCPALSKYFGTSPKSIYVKAEPSTTRENPCQKIIRLFKSATFFSR